jgi:hypothetical protein
MLSVKEIYLGRVCVFIGAGVLGAQKIRGWGLWAGDRERNGLSYSGIRRKAVLPGSAEARGWPVPAWRRVQPWAGAVVAPLAGRWSGSGTS